MRDPVERFYSALRQAVVMRKYGGDVSTEFIWGKLRAMAEPPHEVWDHHLASQAFSLSTRHGPGDVAAGGGVFRVPLDFLGRAEHLGRDFAAAMRAVEARHGTPLPPVGDWAARARGPVHGGARRRANAMNLTSPRLLANFKLNRAASDERAKIRLLLRSPATDRLIRRAYAQDVACFAEAEEGGEGE